MFGCDDAGATNQIQTSNYVPNRPRRGPHHFLRWTVWGMFDTLGMIFVVAMMIYSYFALIQVSSFFSIVVPLFILALGIWLYRRLRS